jgi:5-methylcytosine-specific restriction protein A
MEFKTKLKIGDIIDNNTLYKEFKVSNTGGMRYSKETNTLVLINDSTKGLYIDTWENNILQFIGTGKNGDQVLDGRFYQNGILYNSKTNGVGIHLFEVHKPKEYTYSGMVELADEPYQAKQKGDDGAPRKVWVFPLRKIGAAPSTQPKSPSNAPLVESTLTVGQTVFHFMYGEGEIRSFTDTKIYIQFEIGLRIFPYPAAIQKRYLTA